MTRTLSDRCTPSGLSEETFLAGSSPVMRALRTDLRAVARTDFPVRIEGPTGSGKGLAARMIHAWSPRAQGPFHRQSLAGLPPGLELGIMFGWSRGAFTGALGNMPSMLERACHGTLFLDEIACGSPTVQNALLQLLEDVEATRLGELRARAVDIRLVFATNADLGCEVAAGRFREDLLFRMRLLVFRMPALRDHIDDLPELVSRLLPRLAVRGRVAPETPSLEEMQLLAAYPWPGNVRELEAALEYYLALHRLPPHIARTELSERQRIERAVALAGGNKRKAARGLGIAPGTLYRRLQPPEATESFGNGQCLL